MAIDTCTKCQHRRQIVYVARDMRVCVMCYERMSATLRPTPVREIRLSKGGVVALDGALPERVCIRGQWFEVMQTPYDTKGLTK